MDIKRICILGAGTMGSGIAQAAATAGIFVILRDIKDDIINRGISTITKYLQKSVDKDKITLQEKEAILRRIVGVVDLKEAIKDVGFIIEAATEDISIKKSIFKELDQVCSAETILATNTSCLSITEIASVVRNPERVIGVHFFNPAPIMNLVELIKGACTSDEVLAASKSLVEKMGKTPVEVREAPGFIVNRILIPMINEAVYILMEGIASKEDIDQAMMLGANHPIGPLALGDMIGLDVCLKIMDTLYREFGDPKYRPCPLLTKMVRAGLLGKKSGMGFYDYQRK